MKSILKIIPNNLLLLHIKPIDFDDFGVFLFRSTFSDQKTTQNVDGFIFFNYPGLQRREGSI